MATKSRIRQRVATPLPPRVSSYPDLMDENENDDDDEFAFQNGSYKTTDKTDGGDGETQIGNDDDDRTLHFQFDTQSVQPHSLPLLPKGDFMKETSSTAFFQHGCFSCIPTICPPAPSSSPLPTEQYPALRINNGPLTNDAALSLETIRGLLPVQCCENEVQIKFENTFAVQPPMVSTKHGYFPMSDFHSLDIPMDPTDVPLFSGLRSVDCDTQRSNTDVAGSDGKNDALLNYHSTKSRNIRTLSFRSRDRSAMIPSSDADVACALATNSNLEPPSNLAESESTVDPQPFQRTGDSPGLEGNNDDDDDRPNAGAIVRSIASYLSLSDAESISSLYTLMTPHSYANTEDFGQTLKGAATPHTSLSHMAPLTSLSTCLDEEYCSSKFNSLHDVTDLNSGYDINSKGTTPMRSGSHSRLMLSTVLSAGDEEEEGRGDENEIGTAHYTCEHLGADAAAGFALASSSSCDSSAYAHCGITALQQHKQSLYSNRAERHTHFDDDGTSISPVPDLLPLSPLECNDEMVNGCQKSILEQCDDESNYDDDEAEEKRRVMQENYRRVIQKKLTMAVLSHPKSIRSYCLQAYESSMRIKRHRERRLKVIVEESAVGDLELCLSCQERGVKVVEVENNEQTYGDGGIISVSDDNDRAKNDKHSVTPLRCQGCGNTILLSTFGDPSLLLKGKLKRKKEQKQKLRIVCFVFSKFLDNVPLSVLLDLAEHACHMSVDTILASFHITATTIHAVVSTLASVIHTIWEGAATHLNPFALIDAILTLQRNAVDRTSEAIVTGIQSVATGVSSAGTAAMHVFSRGGSGGASSSTSSRSGLSGGPSGRVSGMKNSNMCSAGVGGTGSSASLFLSKMNLLRNATSIRDSVVSEKMFRKLNKIDDTSKVISYLEREDDVLTQHAKKRVHRMMHYHVSLRPFVATIAVPASIPDSELFGNVDFLFAKHNASSMAGLGTDHQNGGRLRSTSDVSDSSSDSPFMCTPKSFPPTPSSRAHVMARGTRFAEDVVFLARDQLRVEGGLGSGNAQTRAMAKALKDGSRLAVFNAADAGSGIALTCGQHCATKVGNDLYCSIRGMIPVLRNCFVYFEMSVSTPPLLSMMLHHASLSIGLSTLEMPMNSLTGAWKGSVGLCTTGQILVAGQWCSPSDPRLSSYGSNSTIGCLVYLDDGSAFETWDGVMVTAMVTFNVNGEVVMTPAASSISCGRIGAGISSSEPRSLKDLSSSCDRRRSSNALSTTTPPSTLPLFVPREEELFPTLTLHSSDTEVLCRFCSEDVTIKSREEIGAPSNVTVYSVDGSVLFDDDTDEHYPLDDDDDSVTDDSIGSLIDDDGETCEG